MQTFARKDLLLNDPQLKPHKLEGRLREFWAFSIDYNFGFTPLVPMEFIDARSLYLHPWGVKLEFGFISFDKIWELGVEIFGESIPISINRIIHKLLHYWYLLVVFVVLVVLSYD